MNRVKVLFFPVILLFLITAIFSSLLKVYFIDVNQGDASLIITPNNKVMLIDAGDIDEYYDYGEKVYRFIKQLNIDKIDIVLISHPHKDHIGGMYFILSKIKVGSFYDPGFPYPSEVYANLLELINEKQIKYNLARESTNINLDPSVDVKILHPPGKIVFDTPNDNSVVLRVRYKNISVLFTGDIEKKAEIEITNKYKNKPEKIMSNIIKVPHHGSITSSTENFIKLVSPEVAVISCGRNNRFGHPHKSVLQRYKNYGVEILRTDTDGTIEIVIDGNDYRIYSR